LAKGGRKWPRPVSPANRGKVKARVKVKGKARVRGKARDKVKGKGREKAKVKDRARVRANPVVTEPDRAGQGQAAVIAKTFTSPPTNRLLAKG